MAFLSRIYFYSFYLHVPCNKMLFEWSLALVLIAVFPIVVAANLYPEVQAMVDRVLSRIAVMGRE